MKKQVLSIEEMQVLIDKGIDVSNSNTYYEANVLYGDRKGYDLHFGQAPYFAIGKVIPTFTLQDILEILPKKIIRDKYYFIDVKPNINRDNHIFIDMRPNIDHDKFNLSYIHYDDTVCVGFTNENIIDCAYQMLLWCIDNGHIETKKL